MTSFNLRLSAFSICWLRTYDFGLEHDRLTQAIANLKTCSLVKTLKRVSIAGEIDEVDNGMFDVRYQERSNLVRITLLPFELADQDLSMGRQLSAPVTVNLMLDLSSGFGVFNLCLPCVNAQSSDAYTVEEVGFLTRQWLLVKDELGQPQQLNVKLPLSTLVTSMYIREVMNYYFLQLHKALWDAEDLERRNPLWKHDDFQTWLNSCHEAHPSGCEFLCELKRLGLIRSLFPTSFGPIVDVWGLEEIDPDHFDADAFSAKYAQEISWIFTDGQRTNLGESLHNERQTKSLAMFIWPNHAIHINQNRKSLAEKHIRQRVADYGCLDVEVVRILEILNLQSALLHAFDRQLDEQLENVSKLTAEDQSAVIRVTEQRRNIARSLRSFDFFNLFHTAYWEPLYARLLESPRLRLSEATTLVEMKSRRLDEEIQQAVIIQDRTRQQQEREQELDVLRGLHNLGIANDIQSNALSIINFVVSATASFAFTEVLAPLLKSLFRSNSSFPDAYPWIWIALNVGIFVFVAFGLNRAGKLLVQSKSQIIELDGRLDSPYDLDHLEVCLMQNKELEYFHFDTNKQSGYIRIRKPYGVLLLEFDHKRFYRFVLFWQVQKLPAPESMKKNYVDEELKKLTGELLVESAKQVIAGNDYQGLSTKPSPKLYPHQWNWDSAFIAIGIARFDLERAETEIRSLLKGQWKNGMIPQIVYNRESTGYFPNAERWEISRSGVAPKDVLTSGITQPPMITIAVWEISCRSLDTAFAREVYPALLAYHRWFHGERDPKNEGLVSIIHPWESGMDNSPRWAKIMKDIPLDVRPTYQREDNRHVSSRERPSKADYDRFVNLMDLARDQEYSQQKILDHSPFVVQDVLVNSILYRADECLRELAVMLGEPTNEIENWMDTTRQAFAGKKLWNDDDALYYDYDVKGANPIQENTIAAFLPLYAGLVPEKKAQRLVEKHLMNQSEYAPDGHETKFYLPTVSKKSAYFNPRRYWRGPIWVNINWLIIQGLKRYEYTDLARQIRADTLALVLHGGYSEYFDPKTGLGYGTNAFSWSASLVIDLLADHELL